MEAWQVQKSTEWATAGDSGEPVFQSQCEGNLLENVLLHSFFLL